MDLSGQDMSPSPDLEGVPFMSLMSLTSSMIELGYFNGSSNARFPQAAVTAAGSPSLRPRCP